MAPIPNSTLDRILTAQILIAWAGEGGETPRLGWWRTDLISEFGGKDLFQRLLPETWRWALLQAIRDAARRTDDTLRARAHDPDALYTLYRWGFEIDERLDERLSDLKRAGAKPSQALPLLEPLLPDLDEELEEDWDRTAFTRWVEDHGTTRCTVAPAGRRLQDPAPEGLELRLERLVGALAPLPADYPLPHLRSAP